MRRFGYAGDYGVSSRPAEEAPYVRAPETPDGAQGLQMQ